MRWATTVGATLRSHHEIVLAAAFVAMASYEFLEMLALEPSRASWTSLAIHAVQVLVILTATYAVLRAWRRKTAHGEAMARLMEKVVAVQDAERRRVAYDLHDGVAQLIVSAKQHLDTCADLWPGAPEPATRELTVGIARLEQAIVETRRVLLALRPAAVDDGGLVAAAKDSLEQMAQEAGWKVGFTENLGAAPLPATVETAAFRILQEALTNARKHAGAARVDVDLRREAGWLVLDVRDSGGGKPAGDDGAGGYGLGLSSMRERARLLGGSCVVDHRPTGGTLVHARLPLRPVSHDGP
ncbi:MAG: sensor histidine kinase [Gammaproteobacteria bacterium]